ncbi:MAG: Crp/Fnr family transcriptional regulator [Betaproteobacteria bacterium]|nr:Crp/Fnr family transcriptional regulator [Betaproteobacteria bacterium]
MPRQSKPAAAPLYFGLEQDELRALSAHAAVQNFPKNTVIINEGDRTDSIFVIASGRVKVYLRGEDGKEVILNVHGPGEYFGELVLDEGPRSASVATLETSRFFIISKADFQRFLSAHPDFAMKLINRLIHRVRALTENVGNLALLDVYGRVARLLLELAVEQDGKLVVTEKLTQKDIADRVGASREMVSRIFKDLVAGGYITLERKQITINKDLPPHW